MEIFKSMLKEYESQKRPKSNVDLDECEHKTKEEVQGTILCTSCGEVLRRVLHEKENVVFTDCVSLQPKYDRTANFQKVINEFQGKCSEVIPQEVYNSLKAILSKDDVITKCDIKNALKKLKLQKYNKAVHYIHHEFTGVPKNNIIKYNDCLIEDFNYISQKYNKRNFFNIQLVLYVLLRHYGCDYDRSEFFIPKSAKEEDIINLLPQ